MKNVFVNWKTSLAGLLSISPVVIKILHGEPLNNSDYGLIAAALGLLSAKDHNVSGGTVMQNGGTIPIISRDGQGGN